MKCVECGKKEIFKDGVCIECYQKTHTFTNGPDIIDLPVCNYCGAYKYKNTWTADIISDVLRRLIKHNFDISRQLKNVDINTDCVEEKNSLNCKVFITGYIDDLEITEEHDLVVRLKKTVCNVCSKQFGGYYEAIIQIRAENRKLSREELENLQIELFDLVEDLKSKGKRSLFITDMGIKHGGIDFYLSDKNAGFVITKKLHEKYGGIIKKSSKNIGMKDSRQIYRMTFLIRLPEFKKDEIIRFENDYYQIKSINGNNIKLIRLKDWVEKNKELKDIEKAKKIDDSKSFKKRIVVSQNKKEIQVMNEKNYKITTVKKPQPIDFKEEKIDTIKIDDQIFLIPK